MKRAAVWLILILAFVGLADSAYLAKEAYLGDPLICDIGSLTGCNIVAQSPYSKLFGIPLANFGVGFYIILFILAAVEIKYVEILVRRSIQLLAAFGLIVSAYFMFVQFSVINALCVYCLISAGISFLVFILAYVIEPFSSRDRTLQEATSFKRPSLRLPPPLS